MILKAPSFQVMDVNREVEKATHYPKDELLGREALDLFSPEAIEQVRVYLNGVVEKGEGRIDALCLKKKEGAFFEVDISIIKDRVG